MSFPQWLLEGFAAGPSLEARTGIRGENIELNSNVWDIQAYHIAQAAVNATVTFHPDVIVFGGGVMAQQHMLDRVRTKFTALLNGYLPVPDVRDYIDTCSCRQWFSDLGELCPCKRSERKA